MKELSRHWDFSQAISSEYDLEDEKFWLQFPENEEIYHFLKKYKGQFTKEHFSKLLSYLWRLMGTRVKSKQLDPELRRLQQALHRLKQSTLQLDQDLNQMPLIANNNNQQKDFLKPFTAKTPPTNFFRKPSHKEIDIQKSKQLQRILQQPLSTKQLQRIPTSILKKREQIYFQIISRPDFFLTNNSTFKPDTKDDIENEQNKLQLFVNYSHIFEL